MELSKYEYFYVNGSSHSEGGGLEEPNIIFAGNSVLYEYEKKYNVTWKNRSEINYGKRLSEIIGIPCINESKCGSSVERIVRTTYEFIDKNWDNKDKFFIILEKPDATRSEIYLNDIKDYYILNSNFNDEKILEFNYGTREYHNKKINEVDNLHQNKLNTYFTHHFNLEENIKKNDFDFIGLYSFCKQNNIKVFIMSKNDIYFNDCFDNSDVISFHGNNEGDDIAGWCKNNNLLIIDELGDNFNDSHPGYFGHIEYANNLAKFLGWGGKLIEYKNKII
jgi:hypothetical protein